MTAAGHTPPGDRSFAASLVGHAASGLALVAAVSAGFWGLGRMHAPPPPDPVIAPPTPSAPPTASEAASPPNATSLPATTAPEQPAPAGQPTAPAQPATPTPTATFAPSDISVQVLDAAGDGGARADDAARRLRADGYRVVAVNAAVRVYDTTTLFFTPGHEAEARQLAAAYPAIRRVAAKPGNLAATVDVHLVVGSDHPSPR